MIHFIPSSSRLIATYTDDRQYCRVTVRVKPDECLWAVAARATDALLEKVK
jgi:hypothetical protein